MESYFDGEVVYFDIGLVPSLNIQTVEKVPGTTVMASYLVLRYVVLLNYLNYHF